MYSDMTVTGEARREEGGGKRSPVSGSERASRRSVDAQAKAFVIFFSVSFWLDFSHDLSGGGFLFFFLPFSFGGA